MRNDAGVILVLGARGMLGRAFVLELEASGRAFRALGHDALDVTDAGAIARALVPGVELVINCAAYTDVDAAETDEARATAINGTAVSKLVARADVIGARVVSYSTDYVFDGTVFDGTAREPYRTDAQTRPINAYGRSKLVGERHLLHSTGAHLVVRTSWLYAPWGKNFVRTIARACRERSELRVVDDQRGRPTSAEPLARATLALLERGAQGIFHVTDGGECTWFELAREIARTLAPGCGVHPCTSAEHPRPAKRPAFSVLDLSETEALLGPTPSWQERLADVLPRLEP